MTAASPTPAAAPFPPLADLDARRICVIKPSALGDVVQAMPLLPALRRRFPDAEVTWVIAAGLADLVHPHPLVKHVIRFHRRGGWAEGAALLRSLRAARFDLVFDLQGLARTGLMTAATGAKSRVGLETAREGAALAVHHTLPGTGRLMAAHARYWRVAEALGVGDGPRETPIALTPEDEAFALERLPAGRRHVAFVPGARWETKRWPPDKFAAVAARLDEESGARPVIVGAPDEVSLCGEVEESLRRLRPGCEALNLAGRTTLRQLAAVLQRCDAAVSNDTGPMHLAAAVGTPVAGVFTCTDPVRSGPPGPHHRLVQTAVPCAGSYKKKCPFQGTRHHACLRDVTADALFAAASSLLNGIGSPSG